MESFLKQIYINLGYPQLYFFVIEFFFGFFMRHRTTHRDELHDTQTDEPVHEYREKCTPLEDASFDYRSRKYKAKWLYENTRELIDHLCETCSSICLEELQDKSEYQEYLEYRDEEPYCTCDAKYLFFSCARLSICIHEKKGKKLKHSNEYFTL